jgi:hypothetical protein
LQVLKGKFFILPIVALSCVAIWITTERRSTTLLEKRSSVLKEALAARASGSGMDAVASKPKSADQLAKDKGPIDWKKVVAQLTEMRSGGMGDIRTYLRLDRKFSALSKEELISALDEITTLDMPEETRRMLQQLLLEPLCQKDPEYALTRYSSGMDDQDGALNWRLGRALTVWAGKNPAAATAWLDQQVAAGKLDSKSLDGKSRARMRFEGSLIMALISTDPAAAVARLTSLPEDQRADSLQGIGYGIKDKDQLAYANLIRSGLPEKAQAEAFESQIGYVLRGEGYTEVTEYLNRIQATPAERAICVERAVKSKINQLSRDRKVTREDLDAMREWTTRQAPGTTDQVTGVALANSTQGTQKLEFSEAAALATRYHEAAGNDEVLIGFLMAYDPDNGSKEDARVLAAKISDVKKREEILSRFK